MTEYEFENKIKDALHTNTFPSRESFKYVLLSLKDTDVTENEDVRYTIQTATSNIINNKLIDIISIWKSKRIILVPSFIVLLFAGSFALSTHSQNYNSDILKIAEQNDSIEEPEFIDDDEQIILTSFDTPSINDIDTIKDEI